MRTFERIEDLEYPAEVLAEQEDIVAEQKAISKAEKAKEAAKDKSKKK